MCTSAMTNGKIVPNMLFIGTNVWGLGHASCGSLVIILFWLDMWGGAPGRFSLVWLWCEGHTEVRSVPRVFTERSEVPLVTLNLCVMRRYNLGEGDLVSTSSPSCTSK